MNPILQRYDVEVRRYYPTYPKTVDGEDITAEVTGLLQKNLEDSRVLFNNDLDWLLKDKKRQ